MVVPTNWYWCPNCERVFVDLPEHDQPLCNHCHVEKGIPWEDARALHEEFPESPSHDGEHHVVSSG